ncbi:phosphate/phosphite/phosphonate ABC transporter substrate-binding protein [Pinisolibacter sp.]|uniref:phosphate/phosphite/phosphonate ABC transporter substrate-binding protein n=1 Tax=Pinisolibacter sp. TaxID=2172024 RepID=UPI002FDD38A0
MTSRSDRTTGRSSRGPLLRLALAAALAVSAAAPAGAQDSSTTQVRRARPLRLGILADGLPAAAIDRVEPFRLRLAETLGVDVGTRTFSDERALIDAFAAGRVDYAPLTASGYAMAWRLCGCVEPLAAPRAHDGSTGWRIVVVVPTGSTSEKLPDLAGKRLGVSGEGSIGGRRLALRLMVPQMGKDVVAPSLEVFDNPRSAVKAVLERRIDAAVAWSTLEGDVAEGYGRGTLHDMVAAGELAMTDVRVLWASTVMPHGPHTVRSDLAEGPKRRMRDMLVDLDEVDPDAYDAIEPVHAGGFLRIGHAAYAPFVDLVTPRESTSEPAPAAPRTTGSTPPG